MTTCEQVRERLAEHVLGTAEDPDDLALRRHLRGCASCRREMIALGEGLTMFASATHDTPPPPELADRVRSALDEEWRDVPAAPERGRSWSRVAVAAALIAFVASLTWGGLQFRRATLAADDASSYEALLEVLGGKEFRLGELRAAGGGTVEGGVVVYDSHIGQSWAVLFVRAPGMTGAATARLHAPDGRTVEFWELELEHDGDGAAWVVTSVNLEPFDRITVEDDGGTRFATAEIVPA